jgi:putative endonuclease
MDRLKIGKDAETSAERWLLRAGLRLVTRNYRCRGGEIDLIMRDGRELVFVEVRLRRDPRFGGALASVDHHKQRRLALAAAHYLQRHPWDGPCRFDVIGLSELTGGPQWVKYAFEL